MLSNNYNIEFYKIDIDECEEVTQQFDIISVPTFIFMKKQKEIFSKCEGSKVDILKSRVESLSKLYLEEENKNQNTVDENSVDENSVDENRVDENRVDENSGEQNIDNIIENKINDNTVMYNDINSLENYGTLDDNYFNYALHDTINNSPNIIEAKNLEVIENNLNIEKENDLNNFFNKPLDGDEINNLEDFYKLNVNDIGDLI